MSEHWTRRPKVVGAVAARMRLSREERFLIARIDGRRSLAELGEETGLGAERVGDLVAKLQEGGALVLAEAQPSEQIVRREPPPTKEEAPPPPEPLPEEEPEPEPEEEPEPEVAKADEAAASDERNYRKIYEERWHALPADARAGAAKEARGSDLLALCFDPEPAVISAILENPTVGLEHVRLIAQYHRTGTGIEFVSRRADWLRDSLIERRLMRNPMIGEIVLNRVLNPKLLLATYKYAIDRDLPDATRVRVRAQLKVKWQKAPPEQRAELMQRTEARCLILMTGCTFDAKTTAILCGRPINSAVFVQSVAKFGASPPALLAHLLKQAFVRKNTALKRMLVAHPNMPGDAKRSV